MRLLSVALVGALNVRAGDYDNPRLDDAAVINESIKELEEPAEIAQGSSQLPLLDLENRDEYEGIYVGDGEEIKYGRKGPPSWKVDEGRNRNTEAVQRRTVPRLDSCSGRNQVHLRHADPVAAGCRQTFLSEATGFLSWDCLCEVPRLVLPSVACGVTRSHEGEKGSVDSSRT
jgi:hypothetical protein